MRNLLCQSSPKSSCDTTGFSFVIATSISSQLLEYDVSQLSVELAEDRYALLSDIISRAIQRCLIQNCKRWERFASVNREFSQFSTSSAANSLPVYGTLLRLDKSTLGSVKTVHVF